jgi:hypothetical protein
MRFEPTIDGNLRRNFEILLALCAATLAITKVKPLIYLDIQDRQMPKVLVPCPGGHGIAFVYPSIPCLGSRVFKFRRAFSKAGGNREPAFEVRHEKEHEPRNGEAAVEVRNNAY